MKRSQQRAYETLLSVLPSAVKVQPVATDAVRGIDITINNQPLQVKWAGEGTLGIIRAILAKSQRPDIVVARHLSPGSRDTLSMAGIGWVDESGAAEIAIGTILISRTGHPNKVSEESLNWTHSMVAVAEALLCGYKATVSEIETITGLATGTCVKGLKRLSKLNLLESDTKRGPSSARRITDPKQLLASYMANANKFTGPCVQIGVLWKDPVTELLDIGKLWSEQNVFWTSTGAVAASVMAPYLTTFTTAEVYVSGRTITEIEAIAARANLYPMEGGRLFLRAVPSITVPILTRQIETLPVAPWPRVYMDLCNAGVRGEEAAEHLFEVMQNGRNT